jgi:hypothetical protein
VKYSILQSLSFGCWGMVQVHDIVCVIAHVRVSVCVDVQ